MKQRWMMWLILGGPIAVLAGGLLLVRLGWLRFW